MAEPKYVGTEPNGRRLFVAQSLELFPFLRAVGETFVVKLIDKEGQYRCYCNFEGTKEQMIAHIKSFGKLDDKAVQRIMDQAERPAYGIRSTDKV